MSVRWSSCPSRKAWFGSDTEALIGLVNASLTNVGRTLIYPIRYYRCHLCTGYHLTHKPRIVNVSTNGRRL